jgi:hypothetical protein
MHKTTAKRLGPWCRSGQAAIPQRLPLNQRVLVETFDANPDADVDGETHTTTYSTRKDFRSFPAVAGGHEQ